MASANEPNITVLRVAALSGRLIARQYNGQPMPDWVGLLAVRSR